MVKHVQLIKIIDETPADADEETPLKNALRQIKELEQEIRVKEVELKKKKGL